MRILALTFLLFLTSCGASMESLDTAFKKDILKPMNLWEPKPMGLAMDPPPGGSPEFNQGWKDGCHSGVAAYGGDHYRYLGYKYKQDWRMITNHDYYQSWQDSFLYCRWYMFNYIAKPPGTSADTQWIF